MNVGSLTNLRSTIFSLDEILQDISETPTEELPDIEETYHSYKEELSQELKTTDRLWLEFHAGQCEKFGKVGKSLLYRIVNSSIGCPENSIAAANAITILKTMKVSFSCLDLQGIHIPGADLSGAILDNADLSGAILESADLRNASLNYSNLAKANLSNVKLDLPYRFIHENKILNNIIVSPDSKYLVSEDKEYIYIWNLQTKAKEERIKKIYEDFNQSLMGTKIEKLKYDYNEKKIFTPDGEFLFIYDRSQRVEIYAVGGFKRVKTLIITDKERTYSDFSFSSSGDYLITCSYCERNILKFWKIQKNQNSNLEVILKKEAAVSDWISSIKFSKKFPIFYSIKTECIEHEDKKEVKGISLSIWEINALSEVANIHISNTDDDEFKSLLLSVWKDMHIGIGNIIISLEILSTNIDEEEVLFIAIDKTIYSVNIKRKNEQNLALEAAQITKVASEVDIILKMQLLTKDPVLIYFCGNVFCLYNVKNNQLIGRYRLSNNQLGDFTVSLNGQSIFISYLKEVHIYALEALKESKNIFYEFENKIACFSPDMQTIRSSSRNFVIQTYDIETGSLLKSDFLQKMRSYLVKPSFKGQILFSPSTKYIIISGSRVLNPLFPLDNSSFLSLINVENEENYLEYNQNHSEFKLSDNLEYVAFIDTEKALIVYRATPCRIIGKFALDCFPYSQIAFSKNFCKNPKIAFVDNSYNVVICNFVFKDEVLKLFSQKKRSVLEVSEVADIVLQLKFTENDSKLIIACKKRVITWNIEHNQHEESKIQASCLDISRDVSLLIFYNNKDLNTEYHQLCLWSITEKKPIIVQKHSVALHELQISSDNKYIIGMNDNGGMYVWKILKNSFRLLWRTSHNLQTQGLILDDNNLEKDVEEELITKMGAIKI